MENIFKTSKRGIIVILTLCILLGIAGTCMNVTAMAEDTTVATETTAVDTEETATVVVEKTTIFTEEPTVNTEATTVVTNEHTQELMPVMARGCGYGDLTSWYNIDHATKASILGDVSGNYAAIVGNNPDIYYGSNGLIYLCGTGSYRGRTYTTDLYRSWYL